MPVRRYGRPAPPRGNPLWGSALSVVLHGVVIGALVVASAQTGFDRVVTTFVVLVDPSTPGPREFRMPALSDPEAPDEALGDAQGSEGRGEGEERRQLPLTPPRVPTINTAFLDSFPRVDTVFQYVGFDPVPEPIGADDEEGMGPIGTRRRLGPAYAGGYLWIDPFQAALGIVGPSESRVIHVARLDAALRERIKGFIDSMPRDSFALPPPTMWTTTVGEAKWGVDQNWLYLGDFKVPSALLALLSLVPLPNVDYDRAKDAANLARVREDIIRTARAMEDAEAFKSYVRQLRERKDRERREAMDAARAKKDTVKPRPNGVP